MAHPIPYNYWKLEEASGTRYHAQPLGNGGNLALDNNEAIARISGSVNGYGAYFDPFSQTQALVCNDHSQIRMTAPGWTIAFLYRRQYDPAWVELMAGEQSTGYNEVLLANWTKNGAVNYGLFLDYSNSHRLTLEIYKADGTPYTLVSNIPLISTTISHFIALGWDGARAWLMQKQFYAGSQAYVSGNPPSLYNSSYGQLFLGSLGSAGYGMSGVLDEVMTWDRSLSPAELASVENALLNYSDALNYGVVADPSGSFDSAASFTGTGQLSASVLTERVQMIIC
jgi:hypothetical protein